ncbi:MAG: GerMN domain-containing protein [Planctomycetes bacterium]|jgi:hypothetical protein|nr:GerMN domain-containing protein [Planctomycetota bacterium]
MKRFIISIASAFIIVIAVATVLRLLAPEDNWTCENGQWVKHGNPSTAAPLTGCGETASTTDENSVADLIRVTAPLAGATVKSPLAVSGQARGYWFFEASFPAKLLDGDGQALASGIATAQSDWMTEDLVPFRAELVFNIATATNGILVLEKDNPSGLPENAKEIRIPLRLEPSGSVTVKVYFNNDKLDPEISCTKVFPVDREIAATTAVARAALAAMLLGPTDAEKAEGYFTSINPGVAIQSLTIDDGVARADFDLEIEARVGGSCRVSAIRAQIEETLKQFPTVQSVVISVNGRTEDILQP